MMDGGPLNVPERGGPWEPGFLQPLGSGPGRVEAGRKRSVVRGREERRSARIRRLPCADPPSAVALISRVGTLRLQWAQGLWGTEWGPKPKPSVLSAPRRQPCSCLIHPSLPGGPPGLHQGRVMIVTTPISGQALTLHRHGPGSHFTTVPWCSALLVVKRGRCGVSLQRRRRAGASQTG